ncbi:MAG: O-antigen ligase family protein, partial [Elusimicrobia bacterium]|nr:O-antigen ligase family protein [Elusimicrobiota bacterium]
MTKTFEKIIKHFLPILYFSVSLAFYLRTYDSCQIKITLIQIGGALILMLWLIKLIEEYDTNYFKKNLVVIIPILLVLLSNTISHLRSPLQYASGMELIRKVIYFGIALIIMKEFNSEEKIKRLLGWLFFACFVATFYGIIQFLDTRYFPQGMSERGLDPFIWRGAFGTRIFSTFGNPNFYGDFLVVLGPICLAMFFKTRQPFFGILFLMTAFNAIFTSSKGAWIGFTSGFIAFCILYALHFAHLQKHNIKKIVSIIVSLVLLICAYAVYDQIMKRTDSVKFRVYTWMSCWEMINTNPILGTGIGTFYVTYPAFRRPQIFYIEAKHNTESDHPENEYLEVWYDEGIVGFAIFLWIIVLCINSGLKNLRIFSAVDLPPPNAKGKATKIVTDPRAFYMLGFLSAFIGMLSHNLMCVSLRFVSSGIFMWLLVGLINTLTINNPLPMQASQPILPLRNPIPKIARRVIQFIIILITDYLTGTIAIILSIVGITGATIFGVKVPFEGVFRGYFIADVHHNIAIFHSKNGQWSDALSNYNIVAQKNYGFIMAHYFMGNVFNDRWMLNREYHPEWGDHETDLAWSGINLGNKGRIDVERSISKYQDCWTLAPNYVQSHHQAGLLYLKLGETYRSNNQMDKAREAWKESIKRFEMYHQIDPIFAQNYYRLAYVYIQMGDLKKAEETYWRHLYMAESLTQPGSDEKEWVSKQIGRPAESVPPECEIHKGNYHCFYWEDWGQRRNYEYAETYVNLGNLKYMTGDAKKAEEYYLKASTIRKDNVSALKNLAVIYNKRGQPQEALKMWQRIHEINPQDPDLLRV